MLQELLIRGGHVIDPSQSLSAVRDVAVKDGRILAVGPNLQPGPGARVVDARGKLVVPGLIDAHAHVFPDVTTFGLAPDTIGIQRGVTTVVDPGSAGHITLPAFKKHVVDPSRTRVLAFLNFSSIGFMAAEISELAYHDFFNVDATVATLERHRDFLLGIKVRATNQVVGKLGTEPIRMAKEAARVLGLPLLVHLGEPRDSDPDMPSLAPQVLPLLDAGDIVAHVFTARQGGLIDRNGKAIPEARAALERGVWFDIGHGMNNFSFGVFRKLFEQGITFHTITSDLTVQNRHVVQDLCTTLSKFLALGFPLEQVIAMATRNAAESIGRSDVLGSLAPGREADISILELQAGSWVLVDCEQETVRAEHMLVPVQTLRGGELV